ncbi:MAG: hypothetical protein ACO3S2_10750, partial [Burkholderiaceae bacterium]
MTAPKLVIVMDVGMPKAITTAPTRPILSAPWQNAESPVSAREVIRLQFSLLQPHPPRITTQHLNKVLGGLALPKAGIR